ncbi:MAG: hypothetical protein ACRDVM_05780, partial [Acidimicrobiia bacterium]
VYAEGGTSGQSLEVHWRPLEVPDEWFTWDPSLADLTIPEPGVWREVPENEPVPLSDHCTLP